MEYTFFIPPFVLTNTFISKCHICEEATLYAHSLLDHLKQIHDVTKTAHQVTEMVVRDQEEIKKVRLLCTLNVLFYAHLVK